MVVALLVLVNLPLLHGAWSSRGRDLRRAVLVQRRAGILAVVLLAWGYSRLIAGNDALADVGAQSFSALATLAPAMGFALWRPQTPPRAVLAGIALAAAAWTWLLLVPVLLYDPLLLRWRGATVGKMIVGLKVLRLDTGQVPRMNPAVLRSVLLVLFGVALGLRSVPALGMIALAVYQLVLLYRSGQTVGKKIVGIRIVRPDGGRASFPRLLFLRYLVPGLIGAIPLVGFLFALVDALFIFAEDRRTLHDKIADTIVVNA